MARWQRKPEGSNWGRWGDDDRFGTLNLIDADARLRGVAQVREGQAFVLTLPLDLPGGNKLNPNRLPPVVRPNLRAGRVNFLCPLEAINPAFTDVLNDDLVVLHTQYSSHWDGLGHVGMNFDADGDGVAEIVFYNGYRGGVDLVGPDSLAEAGFDSLPGASTSDCGPLAVASVAQAGVQTRAWLVDLAHHLGSERQEVSHAQLREIMAADGIAPEPGDILALRTGFAEQIVAMGGDPDPETLQTYGVVLDGADAELHEWLGSSGIAALVADNYAIEGLAVADPQQRKPMLPLHEYCLVKLGMPFGELWRLSPLAEHLRAAGRSAFFLTGPPIMLPGASDGPVTPIAKV